MLADIIQGQENYFFRYAPEKVRSRLRTAVKNR